MSRLMRTTISEIYKEHAYLHDHLNVYEKAKFDHIANEDPHQSFEFALRELMVFLARYHQQKCIVLIDEYDAPISSAYHSGYYEDAMHFLRPMFSSLLKVFIILLRGGSIEHFTYINHINCILYCHRTISIFNAHSWSEFSALANLGFSQA
jgi:hypothetical protein